MAGWVLAFARGIGEFGATIIFAGNVQGETSTLTLAVYQQLEVDLDVALALSVVLVALSAGILLSYKLFGDMAALDLELLSRLRAFAVDLSRRDRRRRGDGARRAVGRGQDDRPALRRRAAAARRRAASRAVTRSGSSTVASTCRPSAGRSATCRSTTRCSRT